MAQSADSGREARRRATSRRIVRTAVELTDERGLDGWTMDDLAEAVGVSRRTLFNYVPGKIAAVLGPDVEFPPAAVDTFRRGGPTGDLVDDLRVLAREILDEEVLGVDLETARLHQQVLVREPRLLVAVHQRFEHIIGAATIHLTERQGSDLTTDDAHLLVRLLSALFDAAVVRMGTDPDATLAQLFDTAVVDARRLLG